MEPIAQARGNGAEGFFVLNFLGYVLVCLVISRVFLGSFC